jgi:alkylhydroperoxidase family enzyme
MNRISPDAARLIAQQHAEPANGCSVFPEPLEQWDGFSDEFYHHITQTIGLRNMVFRPAYLAVDWAAQFGPVSEQAMHLRQAAYTGKNFLAIAQLPDALYNAAHSLELLCSNDDAEPYTERVDEALLRVLDVVKPSYETIEALQASRVIELAPPTMGALQNWNAAALLFTSTQRSLLDIFTIAEADGALKQEKVLEGQTQENFDIRKEMAPTVIVLTLIDLAIRVSYIVLTVVTLIAALFIGVIANPALWIVAASTSALVFTLIDEFASRAYNPNAPDPIELPRVGKAGAHEDWVWASKPAPADES